MTKYYKSHSCISLNVKLPSGESLHVSFSPKSHNKGSVYSTDNKDIQQGLENSHYFNKLFFLSHVEEKKTEVVAKPKVEEKKEQEVNVSDIGMAKEYLAEKFGVSRTTMRSVSAVMAQAKLHNIVFVGLEEQ